MFFLGVNTPNPFDQMVLGSLHSPAANVRSTPPAGSMHLLSGKAPYVGFFFAVEVFFTFPFILIIIYAVMIAHTSTVLNW